MSAICIGRINAFGGKVVQFLEVSIPALGITSGQFVDTGSKRSGLHDNLLLICVFEGLGPLNGVLSLCANGRASP